MIDAALKWADIRTFTTLGTPARKGKPVRMYKLTDINNACNWLGIEETFTANFVEHLYPAEYHKMCSKVVHTLYDLCEASTARSCSRSRLKYVLNWISAHDLTIMLNDIGIPEHDVGDFRTYLLADVTKVLAKYA